MVLVIARAFDFEWSAVEKKALFGGDGKCTEPCPFDDAVLFFSVGDKRYFYGIKIGSVYVPQFRRSNGKALLYYNRRCSGNFGFGRCAFAYFFVAVIQLYDSFCPAVLVRRVFRLRFDIHRPRLFGSFDGLDKNAVVRDVQRLLDIQPYMAVDARAFVPPPFGRETVYMYRQRIYAGRSVLNSVGNIDARLDVRAVRVRRQRTVEVKFGVYRGALKAQIGVLTL